MIATVRIAPVEKWCEDTRPVREMEGYPEVGTPIQILTDSMEMGECDGLPSREWQMTKESQERLYALVGRKPWPNEEVWICEHMLEMD